MTRKRTTLIRVRVTTLKEIRESMPSIKKDPDRLDWLYKTSPFRLNKWLGEKPKKKQ